MLRIDEIPYTKGYHIKGEGDELIIRFEFKNTEINRITLEHGLRITNGDFYDITFDIDTLTQQQTYFQKVGDLSYTEDTITLDGKVVYVRPKRKVYN